MHTFFGNIDFWPSNNAVQLVLIRGLAPETLVEVGSDHRLADDASLSVMLWACEMLVSGETLPSLDEDQRLNKSSKDPRNSQGSSQEEACYIWDSCGEEFVLPLDLSEGNSQSYVEFCPVCCRANIILFEIDEDGQGQVWAEPEQDYD